jgi:hypothetical protein
MEFELFLCNLLNASEPKQQQEKYTKILPGLRQHQQLYMQCVAQQP